MQQFWEATLFFSKAKINIFWNIFKWSDPKGAKKIFQKTLIFLALAFEEVTVQPLLFTLAAIRMVLSRDVGLFPVVYGRKNLGIIPKVFVNEVLGNDAQTLQERLLFWIDMFLIRQQQLLCSVVRQWCEQWAFAVYTFLRHINCGKHSHGVCERIPWESFPWNERRVFPPVNHGKRTHDLWERHRDWAHN